MLTVRGKNHSISAHERMFLWKCQSFETENVSTWGGLNPATFEFMPNALTIWAIRARHLLSHDSEYWLKFYLCIIVILRILYSNTFFKRKYVREAGCECYDIFEKYIPFLLLTHVGNAVKCCRGKTKKFNIHTSMLLWSRCSSWCFHWRKSCTPFWLFFTIDITRCQRMKMQVRIWIVFKSALLCLYCCTVAFLLT